LPVKIGEAGASEPFNRYYILFPYVSMGKLRPQSKLGSRNTIIYLF